jgi:IS5 family transposase
MLAPNVLELINEGPTKKGALFKTGKRDPVMRHTKKCNQSSFGMKTHIGVDAESGLERAITCTATYVNDVTMAPQISQKQSPVRQLAALNRINWHAAQSFMHCADYA